MQDASAHLETLKAKGTRRYPAYCDFIKEKEQNTKKICNRIYTKDTLVLHLAFQMGK